MPTPTPQASAIAEPVGELAAERPARRRPGGTAVAASEGSRCRRCRDARSRRRRSRSRPTVTTASSPTDGQSVTPASGRWPAVQSNQDRGPSASTRPESEPYDVDDVAAEEGDQPDGERPRATDERRGREGRAAAGKHQQPGEQREPERRRRSRTGRPAATANAGLDEPRDQGPDHDRDDDRGDVPSDLLEAIDRRLSGVDASRSRLPLAASPASVPDRAITDHSPSMTGRKLPTRRTRSSHRACRC